MTIGATISQGNLMKTKVDFAVTIIRILVHRCTMKTKNRDLCLKALTQYIYFFNLLIPGCS
jgi:hypothetical protein